LVTWTPKTWIQSRRCESVRRADRRPLRELRPHVAVAATSLPTAKVVASKEELDCHWPGKVVRYFIGGFFQFVVVICSEMLDRAQAKRRFERFLDKLAEDGRQLSAVFWLQHNPKPRSIDFSQSLEELTHLDRPTIFVAGSRNQSPPRFENFAVREHSLRNLFSDSL